MVFTAVLVVISCLLLVAWLTSQRSRRLAVEVGRLEVFEEFLKARQFGFVDGSFLRGRFFEDDFVGDEDRSGNAQRKRDAVGGPRVDLLQLAVRAHDEFGEERQLL